MRITEILKAHGDLERDVPLCKHTTFRIGGIAKYFIYPKNEMSLLRVIEVCKEESMEYIILGKGSNVLCSDRFFEGVVICLDRYFTDVNFEQDGTCYAQAGVSLILLAHSAMNESLSGLEFASGIPATLGGAIYMNAGAYKSDMASIVKRVYVMRDQECVWLNSDELTCAYRTSLFQKNPNWIILGAEIKLEIADQKEIRELMDARRARRKESQPLEKPSAGSIFRNPEGHASWKLIDDCGLRGKQVGGAKVSEKHSNFIVNEGNATAEDVIELISYIQKTVYDTYHVELKTEVVRINWEDDMNKKMIF